MKIFSFLNVIERTEIDGTQYYRQVLPLKAVHENTDIQVTCMTKGDILSLDDPEPAMLGFDIYAYPRTVSEDCEAFLDKVHGWDALLIIDTDDDLTEDYRLVSGRGDDFKKVLGLVDYVTVSTQALAEHLGQYTANPPIVLENHVDVDWMQSVSSTSRRLVMGKTIGFTGSPTHWADWYIAAVPLQRICRDYPVVPLLHGEMPRYLNYVGDNAVKIGGVPYAVYPVVLKQFDIVLCAVDIHDPFNSGKSAVKALECMALGVVPVCSRFKPYMDLVALGAPVIIVEEETRWGWYDALAALIEDTERFEHLKESGPEWVKKHYDISIGYKQWESFFYAIH